MKALIWISGIEPSILDAFIVLLRNTTWKCGKVERLVMNYLRRQNQYCGCTQSSIKDMLEHFNVKERLQNSFLEAIERLEKRGIIKMGFNPFSSPDELCSK